MAPTTDTTSTSKYVRGGPDVLQVYAGKRLQDAEKAEQFTTEFVEAMENAAEGARISEFDISMNHGLTGESLEIIFSTLMSKGIQVQRLRAYHIPALDDAAVYAMTEWLSACDETTMPRELHLSNCSITTEGFNGLMTVLIDHPALPSEKKFPLWLRVENNYIDVAQIEQFASSGKLFIGDVSETPGSVAGKKLKNHVPPVATKKNTEGEIPQKEGEPTTETVDELPKFGPRRSKGKGKGKGRGKARKNELALKKPLSFGKKKGGAKGKGRGKINLKKKFQQQNTKPMTTTFVAKPQKQGFKQFTRPAGKVNTFVAKPNFNQQKKQKPQQQAQGKFKPQQPFQKQGGGVKNLVRFVKPTQQTAHVRRTGTFQKKPIKPTPPPPQKGGKGGMPAGWTKQIDPSSKAVYFWHQKTQRSQWTKPVA